MASVDFDEQIYAAIEVLLADGPFRAEMQRRCRHLLVDEFQDLTPAHVLLIRLLSLPALDVFGVGDDDQCIYGYAGADPGFLIDYETLFPGAGAHALRTNYRCPTEVVTAAATLLGYNHRRVPKDIVAGAGNDASPGALRIVEHDADDGAAAVVDVVHGWLAEAAVQPDVDRGARPRQLDAAGAPRGAVRRRHPAQLDRDAGHRRPHRAACRARIPAHRRFTRRLRIAGRRRDPASAVTRPAAVVLRADLTAPDLDRRRDRRARRAVPDKDVAKVLDLAEDLRLVVEAGRHGTTRAVLEVVRDAVGLASAMNLLDRSGGGQGASHLDDLDGLIAVADLHPDAATFEAWLHEAFHSERDPAGVTVSTIHRVKGREWDHVAVFGVAHGVTPHRLADDVEEERRVLHVGITRGRRRVTVLADRSRRSPFIDELTGAAPHRPPERMARPTRPEPVTRRRAAAIPEVELSVDAVAAERALRDWRTMRAKLDEVPAYVVLNDRHLRGIAVARPRDAAELAACDGIGPTKLERYGDEILDVLSAIPS